jgi:hypothetical protein
MADEDEVVVAMVGAPPAPLRRERAGDEQAGYGDAGQRRRYDIALHAD